MRADTNKIPLVVDLDGTLTPTDTLVESVRCILRQAPLLAFALLPALWEGRAAFKRRVSDRSRLPMARLPWRTPLLQWLKAERAAGRRLVLATAADQQIADDVADTLQIFDEVLASRDGINLSGEAKLRAIRAAVGDRFAYVGDCRTDLPVWAASEEPVFVAVNDRVRAAARAMGVQPTREFPPEGPTLRVWLEAMRLHQWLKNVLLFVPLITSFSFSNPLLLGQILVAFVAFSLAASGTYLLNDLWDLDNDRQHPRKKARPLASGQIPLLQGLAAALALPAAGLVLAGLQSWSLAGMVLGYILLSTLYSSVLKPRAIADVITLSLLYTYRVVCGALVINVVLSPWLLAFSVFLFVSLALVKRCAELLTRDDVALSVVAGRGYRTDDLVVLWPLGVGAGLCAVLVFGLYISSPDAAKLYGSSNLLWLVGVALLFWISRMWLKTVRGEMHDDPVVFALRDRGSQLSLAAIVAIAVAVHWMN